MRVGWATPAERPSIGVCFQFWHATTPYPIPGLGSVWPFSCRKRFVCPLSATPSSSRPPSPHPHTTSTTLRTSNSFPLTHTLSHQQTSPRFRSLEDTIEKLRALRQLRSLEWYPFLCELWAAAIRLCHSSRNQPKSSTWFTSRNILLVKVPFPTPTSSDSHRYLSFPVFSSAFLSRFLFL